MIARPPRVILDTNTYVSALLNQTSTLGKAVEKAFQVGVVLRSLDTWMELEDVLFREKFDRYKSVALRRRYFESLTEATEAVSVLAKIAVCRDPKDDPFLNLAVDGLADVIVTGDNDLLTLHPFQGIEIVTPAKFMTWVKR